MNGFTIYESRDSMLIRVNLYLGFKDSMKLIDDKDVKFTSLSSISFIESLKPRYELTLIILKYSIHCIMYSSLRTACILCIVEDSRNYLYHAYISFRINRLELIV